MIAHTAATRIAPLILRAESVALSVVLVPLPMILSSVGVGSLVGLVVGCGEG